MSILTGSSADGKTRGQTDQHAGGRSDAQSFGVSGHSERIRDRSRRHGQSADGGD